LRRSLIAASKGGAVSPYRVRVIVDPNFGERLAALAPDESVWIIQSPVNTPVAERIWKEQPNNNHLTGITTFVAQGGTAEDEFLRILDTVDEHHGPYSSEPPYSLLEVTGCAPSQRVIEVLSDLGFTVSTSTSEGFNASKLVA
jgi:hypothetical protein